MPDKSTSNPNFSLFTPSCILNLRLEYSLHSLKHSLFLDKVEVFLDKSVKPLNIIKVFSPYLCSGEDSVSYLLRIARSPEIFKQVHDFLRVIRHNLRSVRTRTTLVISDDGSKTEHKSLWKFTLTLKIGLDTRQVASLVLGEARRLQTSEARLSAS